MNAEGKDDAAKRVGDALATHRAHVDEVLKTGDPEAIKRLYVELGSLLEEAVGEDADATPVLSFAEILPTIEPLIAGFGRVVLDAGCGPDPAFSIVAGRDGNRFVVSMDIGEGIVRLAVDRAKARGVAVHGVVADLEALPFRDAAFDACVCEDTIEHVPNDAGAVREIARVMRSGGRLILGTPNRDRLDVVRKKIRDRRNGQRHEGSHYFEVSSHLREYTWPALVRLSRPLFTVRRRVTTGWPGGTYAKLASALVRLPGFRYFGRMVILELEKR